MRTAKRMGIKTVAVYSGKEAIAARCPGAGARAAAWEVPVSAGGREFKARLGGEVAVRVEFVLGFRVHA